MLLIVLARLASAMLAKLQGAQRPELDVQPSHATTRLVAQATSSTPGNCSRIPLQEHKN